MIKKELYIDLIKSLNIGSSVAEQDDFLEDAKIETPIFNDLIRDRIDLILGTKGSGKTSLFRMIDEMQDFLYEQVHILVITGVEPQGDPVFKLFTPQFKRFSEDDFENFWKIYIINLIYNNFLIKDDFKNVLSPCGKEIKDFVSECARIGIPQVKVSTNFRTVVERTLAAIHPRPIKKIKGGLGFDANNPTSITPTLELEFETPEHKESQLPIYVSELGLLLEKILTKSKLNIWILLDRLDVVFEHGSELEFLALRGLLKAYESFQIRLGKAPKALRIKIFLRDDIFDFLTSPEQFKKISQHKAAKLGALTHITSRSTKTPLRWTKEQIQQLLLKRLILSSSIRAYYKVAKDDLDKKEVRDRIWKEFFGDKVEPGKNRPDSLSWVYARLSDSAQVTPRSAIDFLQGTIDEQQRQFNLNKIDQGNFFSFPAIKAGIVTASSQKYINETKNEYPKIVPYIEKLKGLSANISVAEAKNLYGKDYAQIVKELVRIGVLGRSGRDYKVAFLFRAALGVHPQF